MYKYGGGSLKKKSTPVKLLGQDWDSSKKHLVKRLQKEEAYRSECNWIDEFYVTIKGIQIEMDKGEMSLDTAWQMIFNRNKEGDLREFLENSSIGERKTKKGQEFKGNQGSNKQKLYQSTSTGILIGNRFHV